MILFDITRLLNKRYSSSPTGIDRVSFRYLHYFLFIRKDNVHFVQQKRKQIDIISKDYVNEFYHQILNSWGIHCSEVKEHSGLAADIINNPEEYPNLIRKIEPHHQSSMLTLSDSSMLDQFYAMDYEFRLALLLNSDLSRIIGKYYTWVEKIPYPIKSIIFSIAARSRLNALIQLKIGRFIGHIFNFKNIKTILNSYYFKYKYRKNIKKILSSLGKNRKNETIIYINTSQYLILSEKILNNYSELFNLKYIFFVHDLLQIETPEYFSKNSQALFKKFIDTAIDLNTSFIFNSKSTNDSFTKYINLSDKQQTIKTNINYIGVEEHFKNISSADIETDNKNYFVIIATIEPRKNHLLLLNIWRKLHDCGIENMPKLFVIGNRGWENENIIDMLERCPGLKGNVFEFNHLNDGILLHILSNARALLLPSHYEGWGMPLVEALTMNVPVICSDIVALREAGQGIPEYLDPLDGVKWTETIIEYSKKPSEMREAQLERMKQFKVPDWEQHYQQLSNVIDDCAC